MATWPRTIMPSDAKWPEHKSALIGRAESGRVTTRGTGARGRRWTERYGAIDTRTPTGRGFMSRVRRSLAAGTIWDVQHPDYAGPLGSGLGTPVVSGAGQTGSALVTSG
ncbi:MAG: hypothetical protein RQ723_12070, partial [Desulfuromonadales bacterium]|nr:hypothetical protein [Desulfuromonadales bacterium]